MITKTHDIVLQITEPDYIKTGIKLVSHDNLTNILNIKIYDNNVEIDYSKVHHANIIFAKPDGTFVQGDLVKVSTGYTYVVGTNDTAAPGNIIASIQLYGAAGERLSTSRFSFQVITDLLNPSAVESTTEFDFLEQLRHELEEIDVVDLTNRFESHLSDNTNAHSINTLAKKAMGTVFNATLQNGWTGTLKYSKNDSGFVVLSLNLTAGTVVLNTVVANLPAGYRPPSGYVNIPITNTSTGQTGVGLSIAETGNLYVFQSIFTSGQSITAHIVYYAG